MIKIMFVCLGNICRSPMAEFIFKNEIEKRNLTERYEVCSRATSSWEIGNPVHYGTKKVLDGLGISCKDKTAQKLMPCDYENYDIFIGMDESNRRDMIKIFGGDPKCKVKLLLDYTKSPRAVLDPYYTGDFNATYNDVVLGVNALLNALE